LTSPDPGPRLDGGTGRTLVPITFNLININNLPRIRRSRNERASAPAKLFVADNPTAWMWPVWPGRPALAVIVLLLTTPLGLAGCGHATVPCPTPTGQLDRLRGETERLREDTERAQTEEEAWVARREAAEQRVEEAQARLDSLKSGRNR
jgi:hypothetical protein